MPRASLRDALVGAGLAEFTTNGYAATGIQAITDRARAPRGSFYGHFASKDAFGADVVRFYAEHQQQAGASDAESALARLHHEFSTYASMAERGRFERGCLLGIFGAETETLGPQTREAVLAALDEWAERIEATLAAAYRETGTKVPEDIGALADDVVNGWEAALWRARLLGDAAPLARFLDRLNRSVGLE